MKSLPRSGVTPSGRRRREILGMYGTANEIVGRSLSIRPGSDGNRAG